MCIVCNVTSGNDLMRIQAGQEAASRFLRAVGHAQQGMANAEAALLDVRAHVPPHIAKQYDRAHKAMVKARKAWNRVEELREAPVEPVRPISAKLISADGAMCTGFLQPGKSIVFIVPEGATPPYRAALTMSDGTVREVDVKTFFKAPACANMSLYLNLDDA
jgi:hypothetical protein